MQIRCTQKNFEKIIGPYPQLISSFKGVIVNLEQVDGIEEGGQAMSLTPTFIIEPKFFLKRNAQTLPIMRLSHRLAGKYII